MTASIVHPRLNTSEAIYLFCFARRGQWPELNAIGPAGQSPVFLYPFNDLASVCCAVPVDDYCGSSAEERMKDLNWVGPRATRHEAVIEEVARHSPVAPAHFGTLFSSFAALEELMRRHEATILQFLEKAAAHEEWSVKGMLLRSPALESVHSQITVTRCPGLALVSTGKRYFLERKLQAESEQELNRKLKDLCVRTAMALAGLASESCPRRKLSNGQSDKEMIVHWAFFIRHEAVEKFRGRVDEANSEAAACGLTFELSGPWPPYSFTPQLTAGSPFHGTPGLLRF